MLIKIRDTKDGGRFDYAFEGSIESKAGYVTIVDFDEHNKRFFIRQ
ncbi:MAG: hypothetical protein HY265_06975 [Deltaproteobacteria bacterium]|nr:hypothetical protein [Deltaproteobacteria bacterium]